MAKEKAKPKGSKAKIKEDDFEDSEIEDYSEIDSDYSEEKIEKTKDSNIFGKAYKWLENKYYSFSDWLTKKGINLNKANDFLEDKGIPAFVFVTCLTIIILAVLVFLIINFATKTTVEFNVVDYSGNPLSDVKVSIFESGENQKTRFNETISNGEKARIALKSGGTYQVVAVKSEYESYDKTIVFERGTPLRIQFNELVSYGNLKLTVVDLETDKPIENYTAKINYNLSGKSQEAVGTPTSLGQIDFSNLPIAKDLTLTIEADGYETISQAITINGINESLNFKLQFDISSAQLEGVEARGVILTTTETGDLLDDCDVTVYNLAGEIIANGLTKLGKFTFTTTPGIAIRFVAIKEGYRIYDSDDENKTFRLQKSEETFTAKLIKGSSDIKVNVIERLVGPLSDAKVSLYNLSGNVLSEQTTLLDGQVIFTGLDKNTEYVVTACKVDYLCSQYFVNIDISNNLDAELVKIGTPDTHRLSIYVYDGANNPVSKANVLVYRKLNERFVPIGLGPLQVDLTGYTSVYAKSGETYRVTGIVGDSNTTQEIVIDPIKENKVILIIQEASKELTLHLKDIHGNDVTSGYVTITSKNGEILYEGYVDEEPIKFPTKGYRDLEIEYLSDEGDLTTTSAIVGDSDELTVTLRPTVLDQYPIISFLELRDVYNSSTTILSKDKDYYVVFDIQLPIEASKCGAHFRVGDDTETDSDNMGYGITGFKADTTSFRYSTTYNYGQQAIDMDNIGDPNQLNKWLELYWSSSLLTNKQIMLKVKATEIGTMPIKYRAWCEYDDGSIYRDPEDTILNTSRNNSSRQSLYAQTKEQSFKVLETPADCSNNLCIEYKFLDKDSFDYSKESFFATLDEMYLLELSYYSTASGPLSIVAETDASRPIIGLVNFQETELFPDSKMDSQDTKLTSMDLILQSGVYKKQYLLFNAKGTGVTHIDVRSTFNSLATEKRLSFDIKNKRGMEVIVLDLLPYNSPINIEVKDADSKVAINNALVKIKDEFGELISSTKTARNGKYVINQNFSSSKPMLEVTAPGYTPYTKQLMIAETGVIYAPNSIDITFGDEISQESEIITLVNKGNIKITDLTYTLTPIDEVSGLTTETQLPIQLNPNKPEEIEITATIDPKIKFKSAKSILTIYGFVGNKQVAKEIEIRFYKGQVKDDCLDIKPLVIYSYVGISEGSENEIPVAITNNCKKAITITPELLKAKGTTIKKDENIEIVLPSVTIEPNEEITDYTITVKNNKARKTLKSYGFEIAWRNAYYALPYTKLTVDLVDYSKTLKVTPPIALISMTQIVDERAASNRAVFAITNTGKYILKDIQISRLDEKLPSNIQDKIEPISFEEIKPGQTKQVYINYEGKVDKASAATLFYKVTANSAGSKDPVEARFTVDFRFSSASCLKIDQKKISLYTKIGEEKTKIINITNQCAEDISYVSYDVNPVMSPNEFKMAFGEGTQVALVPAGAISFIGRGQTVPFIFKVKPTKYFTPRFENRVTIIGQPMNNTPLSMVTGEIIWFSIEVEPPDQDVVEDFERIEENIELKVCDDDSTINVTMPNIVNNCSEDGYCDAEKAAEFIAQKIQEMHNVVIDASKQVNDEIAQTTCSPATAQQNGCPFSEILKPDQLKAFKNIPIYLQNDSLTTRTLQLVISNEKDKNTKYSTIKDYLVRDMDEKTTGGLQMSGNRIHLENKMYGCGRYKITIDGAIATQNQEKLNPQRAYFFISIDANQTDACKKSIENIRMFLPKDITIFTKSNTGDTWLTIISGDENIGKSVSKNVFNTEDRFQLRTEERKKFSQLDITIGKIPENNDAIAKLYFNDPATPKTAQAEKINVIVNDKFGITAINEQTTYPELFVKQVSENIKDIVNGTPADVCISKDKSYMLILSFTEDFGALSLKPKTEKLQLTPLEKCTTVTVKSAISESIKIKAESILGIETKFDYQGQKYTSDFSLVVEKDKDTDFNVCFLADLSNVNSWSDKKINIIAESEYRTKGKINSNRKADTNITLLNFGLTPIELLSKTQNTAESLNKESVSAQKSFYTYVYWNKEYNKEDIEQYCDSLKRYNESLGDKKTLFIKPEVCDFEESQSEKNARNTRALKRTGTYFTGCFGTCLLATTGKDSLALLIPVIGQILGPQNMVRDILLNCGLGCGFPAGGMYLTESETEIPFFTWIGKVMGSALGAVGELIGKIFTPNNLSVLGPTAVEVFKTKTATNITLPEVVTNPTYTNDTIWNSTTKINQISGITSTTTGGLSGAELAAFDKQLITNTAAIERGLPGPVYNGRAAVFTAAPADVSDLQSIFTKAKSGSTLDLTKLNSTELKRFNDIMNKGSYKNYQTAYQNTFRTRLNAQISGGQTTHFIPEGAVDDFIKNSDETLNALKAHSTALGGSTDPLAPGMKSRADAAIQQIEGTRASLQSKKPVNGSYQIDDALKTQIDDVVKTNSVVNNSIDDVDNFLRTNQISSATTVVNRTITDADLTTRISRYNQLKLEQTKQLENLKATKKSLEGKGTTWKKTRLNKVNQQIDDLTSQISQVDDSLGGLKDLKTNGVLKNGSYDIPDDLLKKLDKLEIQSKSFAKVGVSKWTKRLQFGANFALDWAIILAANNSGKLALDDLSEEGQFGNMIYGIDGAIPVSEFEKGFWYKVTLIKSTDNYNIRIEKEVPAISDDVKIYYSEDKEIKELITSEHQTELLQSNTPQNPETEDYETTTEKSTQENVIQTSTNLIDLQMSMYSEKLPKLETYDACYSPSDSETACADLGGIPKDYCARFAVRAANKLYGINYNSDNATNLWRNNTVVWDAKKDSINDFDNHLVPGVIISINQTGSSGCSAPSHAILYTGKSEISKDMIIHQFGPNFYIEPLYNRFSHNKANDTGGKICYILVPPSGYATYDNFATNVNLT